LLSGRAVLSAGSFYQGSLSDPSTFEGAVVAGLVILAIAAVVGWLLRLGWRWWHEPGDSAPAPAPPAPSSPPSPQPDLRILSIQSAGGGGGFIDFTAEINNIGARFSRCEVTALVGSQAVECRPPTIDLVPQEAPKTVRVIVPRPQLGDLVPAFANEATLYGEALRVEAVDGEHRASSEWHEKVYSLEENFQRHHIQQRVWRIGRGEETESDHHAEALEQILRQRQEKEQRGPDYDW
jgi:hypothetical protein